MDTKDFNTLVAEQVAAIQGGSILRAVVEAYSAVAMWLQSLVLTLLALTRAATSSGADLDSWVGDFGVTRIGAEYADGMVRFARYTATSQAVVPVGSIAQTRDGSQQYSVQADATQSTWEASLKGYVLPPGITSLSAAYVYSFKQSVTRSVTFAEAALYADRDKINDSKRDYVQTECRCQHAQ